MFAGHYGVGMASKELDRQVPLWVLFLAVQVLDLVWGLFVLLGIEDARIQKGLLDASDLRFTSYPYSHGLFAAIGWAIICGAVVARFAPRAWRSRRAGVVVGLAVFSHWPLDLIVHQSDMPLFGDSAKVGLDLWSSAVATYVVEMLIVAAGLAVYLHATRAVTRAGAFGPWWLAAVLVLSGAYTVFGSTTDVDQAAAGALISILLFPALAWLAERGRVPRAREQRVAQPAPASA